MAFSFQRVVLLLVLFAASAVGIALPATRTMAAPVLVKFDSPLDVPKRLPISVVDGCVCGALAFLQTAMVMVPGGMVWKLGELRANGWRRWVAAGINMGSEWGAFSAVYSVRVFFFFGLDRQGHASCRCSLTSNVHSSDFFFPPSSFVFLVLRAGRGALLFSDTWLGRQVEPVHCLRVVFRGVACQGGVSCHGARVRHGLCLRLRAGKIVVDD